MRAEVSTTEVHRGCGGKIRERFHEEVDEAKKDRAKQLFVDGHINQETLEKILAQGPSGPRDLECLYCGAETAVFGQDDQPQTSVVHTVPAGAYGGRILDAS